MQTDSDGMPYQVEVHFWREKIRRHGIISKKEHFTFSSLDHERCFWSGFLYATEKWDSFENIKGSKVFSDGTNGSYMHLKADEWMI